MEEQKKNDNEEKNVSKDNVKISLKACLIIAFVIFICIGVIIFFAVRYYSNSSEIKQNSENNLYDFDITIDLKPIIYLYPEKETEVSVILGSPESITVSYPTYETGWKVLANSNGDLIDLETGKYLYALYYESSNMENFSVEDEGFIVKSDEITEFLEDKLAMLGLTEREAEEFIVYWLPRLQENEYNYIRFATQEEIEENMPLEITPNPDTVIRVLMTYKGLDNPIEVKEQELITPERTGFVAVEWGGTEIK